MVTVSPRLSVFDLLVFDADGIPVLAVEVKGRPGTRDDAKRALRQRATPLGIPYGLVVDPEDLELLDLTDPAASPLLVLPTRELLTAYAHGLDARDLSGAYLELLVDTWLRNIMQPLPADPPPGLSQLNALGLISRLRDGRKVAEARSFF